MNGEQALVYARNRKQLANGDFGRAEHQQEIIMALVNKIKTIKDVSTFMDILNTVSNSMDTNLTTKQILSFYNVGKDILKRSTVTDNSNVINVQRLYLQGTGQMIYDERAKMVLWDYVPNQSSRKDIINAMKVNLGKKEHSVIKKINDPYEIEVIGEGPYKSSGGYTLLPNFVGDSESQARSAAARLGISVSFKGNSGYVVSQNYPANKRVDLIKGSVTLTLSGSRQVVSTDDEDNKKDDDENTTKNNVVTEDEGEVQDNSKITPSPTPPPEKDPITPSDSKARVEE